MKLNSRSTFRAVVMIALMLIITIASKRLRADTGTCGLGMTTLPFTDVSSSNSFFCSIASAYFTGLTNGTSSTTYSPSANVSREQMAAFVSRTMDQSLKRGSRRAALDQYWTPTSADGLALTTVGGFGAGAIPMSVKSDGADLWVSTLGTVSRVRASDGKLLEDWELFDSAGVLSAKGLIFVTGSTSPGKLYQIYPYLPVELGSSILLTGSLGAFPSGIAFDGARIWTANVGPPGSVSIVTLNPLNVTTVASGFISPNGILYDGANIWVTDANGSFPGALFKLNSNGAIIQTVTVGTHPGVPVFDGTNIWVPNSHSDTVTVVRASTGTVLATLTGNGLNRPFSAAFDGERILVTEFFGDSVSLWKAADLTPLGSVDTGANTRPFGACSDGLNFWITLSSTGKLARF